MVGWNPAPQLGGTIVADRDRKFRLDHLFSKTEAARGIEFEALDNGLLRCANPAAAQRIAEGFDEKKIERFFRKWLSVLPRIINKPKFSNEAGASGVNFTQTRSDSGRKAHLTRVLL